MATCVCHHGATARQGGAAGAEEAPHSRVWAHPARRPVACRGGAPACVAAHSPRRRRHTRWPASGAAASAAEASAPAVSCGTARAVGQREEQEDTLLVLPRLFGGYTYAAVFDGHGGSKASEYLQRHLHGALKQALEKDGVAGGDSTLSLAPALTETFEAFDERLIHYLLNDSSVPKEQRVAGSTATVALVRHDRVVVANCGDSRAVLCRGNGSTLDISRDHRPSRQTAAGPAEIARVIACGGWVSDGRVLGILGVSRAFGGHEFKAGRDQLLAEGARLAYWKPEAVVGKKLTHPVVVATPDVSQVDLLPGDQFVLLATDGLWDCCTSAQASIFVRGELAKNGGDAQATADALVSHAVGRRKAKDNVAAIVVVLNG